MGRFFGRSSTRCYRLRTVVSVIQANYADESLPRWVRYLIYRVFNAKDRADARLQEPSRLATSTSPRAGSICNNAHIPSGRTVRTYGSDSWCRCVDLGQSRRRFGARFGCGLCTIRANEHRLSLGTGESSAPCTRFMLSIRYHLGVSVTRSCPNQTNVD